MGRKVWAILTIFCNCLAEESHKTVSVNHNLWREVDPKRTRTWIRLLISWVRFRYAKPVHCQCWLCSKLLWVTLTSRKIYQPQTGHPNLHRDLFFSVTVIAVNSKARWLINSVRLKLETRFNLLQTRREWVNLNNPGSIVCVHWQYMKGTAVDGLILFLLSRFHSRSPKGKQRVCYVLFKVSKLILMKGS